jgi:hypothetical protein
MRIAALCVGCLGLLAGSAAGIVEGPLVQGTHPHAMPAACLAAAGVGGGLLFGVLSGIWLLCLGYVYGDARRRAMPAIPWTLIAAFVPNLLGFLFYFVMRRPIGSPCPQCGQSMATEQRFCSWCGYQRLSPPEGTSSGPGYSGMNPTATV